MLKTPKFWHHKGFIANLLIPFSVIYFLLKRIVLLFEGAEHQFKFKTIFVGNPIAGGSGKTPAVIALSEILKAKYLGKKIAVISKGYGGSLSGPELLDSQKHTAEDAGDEPLLIAKNVDVIIANNRFEGCKFAEQNGYEIVVFDDGMHDNRIKKDICFMVVDGNYGFGNGLVFPAGPLRDRLDIAAKNATHTILIGRDEKNVIQKLSRRKITAPVLNANISAISQPAKNQEYIAFAGLGRPEKFFNMLKINMSLNISETIEFPDHHQYSDEDISYIKTIAEAKKAQILTTEKDFVKLPLEFQNNVEAIAIEMKLDEQKLYKILDKKLAI